MNLRPYDVAFIIVDKGTAISFASRCAKALAFRDHAGADNIRIGLARACDCGRLVMRRCVEMTILDLPSGRRREQRA
eukprot:3921714-Pleurochrysis_carterae.AAC.1